MGRRHGGGPRRSHSLEQFLRPTRLVGVVAVALLAAAIAIDATEAAFWDRHALLSGLVASLIVVVLSLAVLNEVLDRRRRSRWRVLAQYIMLALVRNARMFWTGVVELAGLAPDGVEPSSIDAIRAVARDEERLTPALADLVADGGRLRRLHHELGQLVPHIEDVLGRWAGVMLNAGEYAEVIDRHVELAGDISWLNDLLENAEPSSDSASHRRAANSPAAQLAGRGGPAELAQRLVVITQLAEELDRVTLELALRLVPFAWWAGRLGATPG